MRSHAAPLQPSGSPHGQPEVSVTWQHTQAVSCMSLPAQLDCQVRPRLAWLCGVCCQLVSCFTAYAPDKLACPCQCIRQRALMQFVEQVHVKAFDVSELVLGWASVQLGLLGKLGRLHGWYNLRSPECAPSFFTCEASGPTIVSCWLAWGILWFARSWGHAEDCTETHAQVLLQALSSLLCVQRLTSPDKQAASKHDLLSL